MTKNKNRIEFFREKYKKDVLPEDYQTKCVPTGSIQVDKLLNGGIRPGITEIFGPEGCGKSTLAFSTLAQSTKHTHRFSVLIDVENGVVSTEYLAKLNINLENLLIIRNGNGEEVINIIEELMNEPLCEMIVVDSVAALSSETERTTEAELAIGSHARLVSKMCKKIMTCINNGSEVLIILINQVRSNISANAMFASKYQTEQFITTGGKSLKYFANLRLEVSHKESIYKPDKTRIGSISRVKVIKSRYAAPHQEATYPIIYGRGFSKSVEVFNLGIQLGLIEQQGSWYRFKLDAGVASYNSKMNAYAALENEEICNELIKKYHEGNYVLNEHSSSK